jgi:hypothetical protein
VLAPLGSRRWQKRDRRINTVQIMCTHVCKCKNDNLLKLFQESGEGMKESSGWNEFKYDVFDTL